MRPLIKAVNLKPVEGHLPAHSHPSQRLLAIAVAVMAVCDVLMRCIPCLTPLICVVFPFVLHPARTIRPINQNLSGEIYFGCRAAKTHQHTQ